MNKVHYLVVGIATILVVANALTTGIHTEKDAVCQTKITLDSSKEGNGALFCAKANHADIRRNLRPIKQRRYDIENLGLIGYFHGWADVQGQGACNDYCRFIKTTNNQVYLSCALAGTHGESDLNYNSSEDNFDAGHFGTWYMRDEDRDGRDDYCRCAGSDINSAVLVCTKAGPCGFFGSPAEPGQTFTFNRTSPLHCRNLANNDKLRPEFGSPWRMPTS